MAKTALSSPYWGNNIKQLMDIHGKKVPDMALELEVSEQAIYDLINKGVYHLTAKRAAQLQAAFGGIEFYKIFPLVEDDDA